MIASSPPRFALAALLGAATIAIAIPASAADPTVQECLGANETSIARRRELKFREAQAQLLVCTASSCPAEVREECNRRMNDVKNATPTVVLGARSAAGADVTDVIVTMDGQPFATRLDGLAKEVDPGEHLFTFEMPGAPKVEQRITLKEGEKGHRESITFAAPTTSTTPSSSPTPSSNDKGGGLEPLKLVAMGAGALGLISLGIGVVFSAQAISLKADARCESGVCPTLAASVIQQDAKDKAATATPFAIAGGVLLLGGVTLYMLAPSPKQDAPGPTARIGVDMVRGGAALSCAGSW